MEILKTIQRESTNAQDVVVDGKLLVNVPAATVMVEASTDLPGMGNYPPGTVAYTAGYKGVWQLNGAQSAWVDMIGSTDVDVETPAADDDSEDEPADGEEGT